MGATTTRPRWSALRSDLAALHAAALAAADPGAAVRGALRVEARVLRIAGHQLPLVAGSSLWLVAAGKAARGMAAAALAILGERVRGGVVVHPHQTPAAADEPAAWPACFALCPAAHPLPDEGSLAAGAAVRRLLASVRANDLVLVLLSGGASALLEDLRPGVTLGDLREATGALQRAGADVTALNTVRRALSTLKGGGLARLAGPARVVTLALSDVLGDPPAAIGSGPTVPSPSGPREALAVLTAAGVAAQVPAVVSALAAAAAEPAPGELTASHFHVAASNHQAAAAVARAAAARGFAPMVVTTFLQGEAREAGRLVGGCAASVRAHGVPLPPPACLVFGGETTVRVRGGGRGGRNQELALGAAFALAGVREAAVLAFATDGVDGASTAAGALVTGDTLPRAAASGLSPQRALDENDSEPFFRALGDHWEGGPTGTNVNDLAVVLVY